MQDEHVASSGAAAMRTHHTLLLHLTSTTTTTCCTRCRGLQRSIVNRYLAPDFSFTHILGDCRGREAVYGVYRAAVSGRLVGPGVPPACFAFPPPCPTIRTA